MLCDLVSEEYNESSVEYFNLSVGLQVVNNCREVVDA